MDLEDGMIDAGSARVILQNEAAGVTAGASIEIGQIRNDSRVMISRNVIGKSTDGVRLGEIAPAANASIHNNFVLGNVGDGIQFTGDVRGTAEVFQNFIAGQGGDGIGIGSAANIGSGNLALQQNFVPGNGFEFGNGGFAANHLGTGTPNLEANWWGTFSIHEILTTLHGVGLPSNALASGDDTNTPSLFGETGLDPFAFQNDQLTIFGRFPNLTYDRFIRYQDFFRTIASLLDPKQATIRYPAPTVTNELDDHATE
mgnify:CR=1 FL=1